MARAEEDPLAKIRALFDDGTMLVETGTEREDVERVRRGVRKFREARRRLAHRLADPGLTPTEAKRARALLVDVESRIEWYSAGSSAEGVDSSGEVRIPEMKRGESLATWCRRVRKLYDESKGAGDRAALARGLAAKGGTKALSTLLKLFEEEAAGEARVGIHEGLAMLGTPRVAGKMATYAKKRKRDRWADALEVTYLCLARIAQDNTAQDPVARARAERPFLAVVRSFHKLKDESLSRGMLERLDDMEPAGTAALGEVLYLPDFGLQAAAIERLSRKQDERAVAPLMHRLERSAFDPAAPTPAHRALLKLRWYAVPLLIERVADKSAGPWVAWTLEKISRAGLGADGAAWHAWWQRERLRHPEVLPLPAKGARPSGDGDTGGK